MAMFALNLVLCYIGLDCIQLDFIRLDYILLYRMYLVVCILTHSTISSVWYAAHYFCVKLYTNLDFEIVLYCFLSMLYICKLYIGMWVWVCNILFANVFICTNTYLPYVYIFVNFCYCMLFSKKLRIALWSFHM